MYVCIFVWCVCLRMYMGIVHINTLYCLLLFLPVTEPGTCLLQDRGFGTHLRSIGWSLGWRSQLLFLESDFNNRNKWLVQFNNLWFLLHSKNCGMKTRRMAHMCVPLCVYDCVGMYVFVCMCIYACVYVCLCICACVLYFSFRYFNFFDSPSPRWADKEDI